ncbi:MAG: DUF4097 family beta strand repeat-containing protein, partial [Dehalococcoidia bacterium]|nr:DUF4097 family beta strand repeat-containing protein [Dehalococcoidia bacterium]
MGIQHPLQPGASLRILASSGEVVVTAEERDDLDVEPPDRHVEMKDGGTAEVKSRSGSLRVRCPKGTDVSVGVISGRVRLAGEFGSVKVSAVSGHIEIDSASGDVDVRSVSGHLSVNTCGGRCQLNTKSGRIRIGWVEMAARVSTLSGSVEIGTAGEEEVVVKSISGGVTVRVAE